MNQLAPDTEFDRVPHLSRGGSGRAHPATILALAPVAVLLAVALGFYTVHALNSHTPLPPVVNLTLVTVGGAAAFLFYTRNARRAYNLGRALNTLPANPDDRYRVRVACWPDRAEPFRHIVNEPFEPETFRVWVPAQALLPSVPKQFRFSRPGIGGAFGLMAIGSLFQPLLYVGIALAATEALLLIRDHRRPSYLRIVPGRVDLLRYPLFGSGPPKCTTLDLRTQRIYIDGIDRRLTVETPGRDTIVGYRLSKNADEITRQLVRATVSTAEPAPLPEKDLTG